MAKVTKVAAGFGQQLAELEGIAAALERGEIDLEEGLRQFKRGMELVKVLNARLTATENEIKLVKRQHDIPEPKVHDHPGVAAGGSGTLF